MGIRLRCAYESPVETITKAADAKAGRESARPSLSRAFEYAFVYVAKLLKACK